MGIFSSFHTAERERRESAMLSRMVYSACFISGVSHAMQIVGTSDPYTPLTFHQIFFLLVVIPSSFNIATQLESLTNRGSSNTAVV